jgi:hypothetical protein
MKVALRAALLLSAISLGGPLVFPSGAGAQADTKKPCSYEGRVYSHGSEVCQDGHRKLCNDGVWEDMNQKC